MKKSLIVIALVLLMIVPVFAEDVRTPSTTSATTEAPGLGKSLADNYKETDDTQVYVQLELNPTYVFGITGGKTNDQSYVPQYDDTLNIVAVAPSTGSYTLYTDVKEVEVIAMTKNYNDMKLEGPGDDYTYYVSYWFFENDKDNLSLTMKLDGDMILQNATSAHTVEANKKIPYQVTVNSATLKSNAAEESDRTATIVTKADIQTQIGAEQEGNVAITIAPLSGSESIKDKYAGTYISHIVLTLAVGA
jgi:hypothetical protein